MSYPPNPRQPGGQYPGQYPGQQPPAGHPHSPFGYEYPPTDIPRRRRRWPLITALAVLAVALCLLGVAINTTTSSPSTPAAKTIATATQAGAGPAPHTTPPAAASTLSAANIQLTVHVTSKDCFGSAGCNVEYQIRAALDKGVQPQECEITYDVLGLEDTQTGTLNLHSDGTYAQADFQSGQTTSTSSKLTAKVTDVSC